MNHKFLYSIVFFTIFFCIFVVLDITPLLRGPAPYPPDWRWDYLYSNTWKNSWFPLGVFSIIFFLIYKVESYTEKTIEKQTAVVLTIAICLFFILQFSLLYFSRTGIGVLLARIINPEMNGYFTAAINIQNIQVFLHTYNQTVLTLPMHAQGHPPGAILFFWMLLQIVKPFEHSFIFLQSLHIGHTDVKVFWDNLAVFEKASAVCSAIIIPLLSSFSLIPLYYIVKLHANAKIAMRSVFLYMVTPSILFFIPINDVFLPLIVLISFLLFCLGIKKNKFLFLFMSGICFSVGLFFSLSLLPIVLIFLIYALYYFSSLKKVFLNGGYFISGFLILPIFLYIIWGYNSIDVTKTLMSGLPKNRSYEIWVLYNVYDFFIFAGVPVLITFVYLCKHIYSSISNQKFTKIDPITFGFITMLFLLDISGSVRGEVARIWIPFYVFLCICISTFLTRDLKISKQLFLTIIVFQAVQIIVMQEFWVMLW